jgi:aryl-alcohol dehydrogenase-like predicted oxidoreductase
MSLVARISKIGLGTVKLGRNQGLKYAGGFPLPDDEAVRALLDCAAALGVTLLDTAPAYGDSEAKIGRAVRGARDRWVISTKVGEYFEDGRSRFDFSAEATEASLANSLRQLQTDHLDMVLVHSTGEDRKIADETPVLEVLTRWRDRGDIGAIGMSTKTVSDAIALLPRLDAVMVTLNPSHTDEIPVIEAAHARDKIVLVKKALYSGALASTPGSDPVGDALRFSADQPGVTSIVVGTLNAGHLAQAVQAVA